MCKNVQWLLAIPLFFLLSANAQDSLVVPLWKTGAPGFENKIAEPEQAKDWWVKNIHYPSITIFQPAKEKSNGTAVVICPGGGFRALVFKSEGVEAARYFTNLGITAIVLKYRLFREENSGYNPDHVKQDIFRAIRLTKSMATQLNIDTARIGVMGFSAGGEVAGWLSYQHQQANYIQADAIDLLPARPAFQVLVYPGPLVVPDSINSTAPATFLVAANDDACCSEPVVKLLQMHRAAKVPVEVHLYSQGDHAFNMGKRTTLASIKNWPARLTDWLSDNGWLKSSVTK
ncbi:MAG: hypothetical protein RL172_2903 [Bacteroidota bacterium]|jgi:acetyl esterase/lipase